MIRLASCALLLISACAGTPADRAPGEARECRTLDITGSKIAKRDCRTISDWAQHDEEEAARAEAATMSGKQNADPNSF